MGIEPGTYFIQNIDGDVPLVVQYRAKNAGLVVDEKHNVPAQKWIIFGDHDNHTKPQSIIPVSAKNLKVSPVGNLIKPTDSPYSWYISGDDGVYIVQDENQRFLWCLDDVQVGQQVVLGNSEEAKYQSWDFIKTKSVWRHDFSSYS